MESFMTQESDQEQVTDEKSEAVETSTPDVTDGAPSSGAAAEEETSLAETMRDEFLKEFGEEEDEEGENSEKGDEPEESSEKSKETSAEREDAPDDKDDADDEFRLSDDEFKGLPDSARKRIGHLNARAKKAERKLSEYEQELETTRDSHERFNRLQTFVQENEIQPENVTLAFDAMARLSHGDHKGFLEAVMPWVEMAQQAVGQSLPQDLQRMVDDGEMTDVAAREVSKARIQSANTEAREKKMQAKDQERSKQQKTTDHLNKIAKAVDAREAELKSSDPDYAHKAAAVKAYMEDVLSLGARPNTEEEAVTMLNKAYDYANSTVKKKPAPRATPPSPSASTVSRGQSVPKTLKDAIGTALESMPST